MFLLCLGAAGFAAGSILSYGEVTLILDNINRYIRLNYLSPVGIWFCAGQKPRTQVPTGPRFLTPTTLTPPGLKWEALWGLKCLGCRVMNNPHPPLSISLGWPTWLSLKGIIKTEGLNVAAFPLSLKSHRPFYFLNSTSHQKRRGWGEGGSWG